MAAPTRTKDKSQIQVCPHCGSQEVEIAKWTKVNSGEITGDVDAVDPWCPNCGDALEDTISLEQYEDKEKEVD